MKQPSKWLGALRLVMGWTYLWAFMDKLWGLGFTTAPEDAWLAGGSPTYGFLSFGTHGPLSEFYQSIAGHPVVDTLFMLGLLGIGLALILGVAMRLACYAGVLLMALMWSSLLPPEHNPVVDEHVVYALTLLVLNQYKAGHVWGLGRWWATHAWVKRTSWLQ